MNPTDRELQRACHVALSGVLAALDERHRDSARTHGQWLFDAFAESPLADYALTDIEIGSASDDTTIDVVADAVRRFATMAS